MKRAAALAGLAALAACHRAPPANTQAEPAAANLADVRRIPAPATGVGSAALPAPELAGVATAPGRWRFQVSADGAQAVFGAPGRPAEFALRCDADARRMIFTRAASGGSGATLEIVAETGAATFDAAPDGHGRTRASDFVTDTFLTQVLAEAKGRIGVRVGAGKTLAMPADPAIGDVIRRCAAPRG
ncbi:MAG TPA: hypothetical protein VFT56_02120 [Sphingomonas sp.]|nr:hypothetical protein [Sphingomonas sp.]